MDIALTAALYWALVLPPVEPLGLPGDEVPLVLLLREMERFDSLSLLSCFKTQGDLPCLRSSNVSFVYEF